MTKYLKTDPKGNRKYRRRVPDRLQSALGKKEFVKLLGKTDAEAMKNYGPYHDHIEQLLASTRSLSDPSELLRVKASIEAEFAEVGADPYSPGASEDERVAREEQVERIFRHYPIDPNTGYPNPESVSIKDSARFSALLSGTDAIEAEPTLCNAFELYVSEINQPDLKKRKSQIDRVRRIEGELLNLLDRICHCRRSKGRMRDD